MIRIIYGLDLDMELIQAIEDYPELEEAHCKLSNARTQYEETEKPGLLPQIQQLEEEVKNTRARLLRALRYNVRKNFDEEQAFLDIEAQLSGTTVEEDEDRLPLEDDMHPPVASGTMSRFVSNIELTRG
ncbi:hypothetical protein AFGD_008316 [Aspergillus flavus]|nr:hypothetical protein AFGD_008316 [Aspergillus flavus]